MGKASKILSGLPLGAVAGAALGLAAPALFQDHFGGTSLRPHWDRYSEGSSWDYTVGGGQLHVNRLFGPFYYNEYTIATRFPPAGDFAIVARVGWDAGNHQGLRLGIGVDHPHVGPRIATLRYRKDPGQQGQVDGFINGGGTASIPASSSGYTRFQIVRIGSTIRLFANTTLVHQFTNAITDGAAYLWIDFQGPDNSDFAPLRVDFVQVSPLPQK